MFGTHIQFPSLNICLTSSPWGQGASERLGEVRLPGAVSQHLHSLWPAAQALLSAALAVAAAHVCSPLPTKSREV